MDSDSLIYKIIFNKEYQIPRHIFFWCFIYIDELISFIGLKPPLNDYSDFFLVILLNVGIVLFNLYFLMPRFLLKGKIILYLAYSLFSVLLVISITHLFFKNNLERDFNMVSSIISELTFNITLLAFAVAIKISKHFFTDRLKMEELKESQMQSELAFLKNQVNPHFMFNTLNGLYVMSKKNDDNLSNSIMKLSDLMRYQIYEAEHKKVSLKNEIEYLQNYLGLEKMRRSDLKVTFKIEGDPSFKEISPLLLISFVENAFKHSFTLGEEKNNIHITIILDGDDLHFECVNNIGIAETTEGGIGLKNVKRRLALLYPNKYKLSIKEYTGLHKVNLSIRLE